MNSKLLFIIIPQNNLGKSVNYFIISFESSAHGVYPHMDPGAGSGPYMAHTLPTPYLHHSIQHILQPILHPIYTIPTYLHHSTQPTILHIVIPTYEYLHPTPYINHIYTLVHPTYYLLLPYHISCIHHIYT